VYCAIAVAVVAGGVTGRCSISGSCGYTLLVSAWTYPFIAHWLWSSKGWLSPFNSHSALRGGAIDFAGSGVVFMVGGWTSICGSFLLGPRRGVFDDNDTNNNKKVSNSKRVQNIAYQVAGVLLIWFGWYGFNPGRTKLANNVMSIASKVAVTTTIAATSGGISSAIISKNYDSAISLSRTIDGVLAGLVSISAPCATVNIGDSIAIAVIGVIIYYGSAKLLINLKIDDPLRSFPIYGCCGMWGLIATAWFSSSGNIERAGYSEFLQTATRGRIFAAQILAILVIAGWSVLGSFSFFVLWNQCTKQCQCLRSDNDDEEAIDKTIDDDDDKVETKTGKKQQTQTPEDNFHDNTPNETKLLVTTNETTNVVPDDDAGNN